MIDLFFLALTLGFFALMLVFIWACEKVWPLTSKWKTPSSESLLSGWSFISSSRSSARKNS